MLLAMATFALREVSADAFSHWGSAFGINEQSRVGKLIKQVNQHANLATGKDAVLAVFFATRTVTNGNDSGAVCTDENGEVDLKEADVNLKIARLVQKNLEAQGYQVDLLNEFDTRLNGYRAVALVSIHNDSCEYVNDEATGFKVASSLETRDVNRAQRLNACLVDRYQRVTNLTFHANSITGDMREYHAFYGLTPERLARVAPDALVMHPGPMNRGVEITSSVADDIGRSAITEQVEMGVAVRMACLDVLTRGQRGIGA